jgi:LMBR1-like membrane protein
MALSDGLIGWGVLCFLFTLGFTAWLLHHFSRPKTPPAIYLITYLAWLCAFSIVFLIPLDIQKDAADSLEVVWTILFWVGFVCTWMMLPMVQEYYDNGGFTWKQKLRLACKQNGILVLVAGSLVIILVVYLKVSGKDNTAIGVRCMQGAGRQTEGKQLMGFA